MTHEVAVVIMDDQQTSSTGIQAACIALGAWALGSPGPGPSDETVGNVIEQHGRRPEEP